MYFHKFPDKFPEQGDCILVIYSDYNNEFKIMKCFYDSKLTYIPGIQDIYWTMYPKN